MKKNGWNRKQVFLRTTDMKCPTCPTCPTRIRIYIYNRIYALYAHAYKTMCVICGASGADVGQMLLYQSLRCAPLDKKECPTAPLGGGIC